MLIRMEAINGLLTNHAEMGSTNAPHVVASRVALNRCSTSGAPHPIRLIRSQILFGSNITALICPLPTLIQFTAGGMLCPNTCAFSGLVQQCNVIRTKTKFMKSTCFHVASYAAPVTAHGAHENDPIFVHFNNSRTTLAI